MTLLNKGIGKIKVAKQEDGTYTASAENVGSVTATSESQAILKINDAIKAAIENDEQKAPFRILQ